MTTNQSCRSARVTTGPRRGEAGFALILALLALMLLTFLGLTLATTTSTELQIATNYRWSQQALFNAEAGVEAGKSILRSLNWGNSSFVPAARTVPWPGDEVPACPGSVCTTNAILSRNDASGNPTRNYENWQCDLRGRAQGYGAVLDDNTAQGPYQYKTSLFGQNINGAFTLWIRRPLIINNQGEFHEDAANNDVLILVSEGTAPFTGGSVNTTLGSANRANQIIEVTLSRTPSAGSSVCGTRGGQAGGGPEGAGFGACAAIDGTGVAQGLGVPVTEKTGVQ